MDRLQKGRKLDRGGRDYSELLTQCGGIIFLLRSDCVSSQWKCLALEIDRLDAGKSQVRARSSVQACSFRCLGRSAGWCSFILQAHRW